MKKVLNLAFASILGFSILLTGCSSTDESKATGTVKAGTYTTTQPGIEGDIKVTVEVDKSGKMTDLKIDQNETEGVGAAAAEELQSTILENQTVKVDTVSGATGTSTAVIKGVMKALQEAGVDTGNMKDLTTTK